MTPLETKRQFVLLILQYLNDENYKETAHQLEKESGFFFDMEYFEEIVTQRELDEAEKYLSCFTTVDENPHSMKIFFEIRKQKFLEALDRHDKEKAEDILENELKLLIGHDEKLSKEIMTLLTLKNFREMEKLSGYVDANSARANLAVSLKAFIHENIVFQDKLLLPGNSRKRLWELLKQSMYWQHEKCMNDWPLTSLELETLFEDHICKQPPGLLAPFPANDPGGFMSSVVGKSNFTPEPARAMRSPIMSFTPNAIIERRLLPRLPASIPRLPPPATVPRPRPPGSAARPRTPRKVARPRPPASIARSSPPASGLRLPLPESVATELAKLQPPPVTVAILPPATVARMLSRVPQTPSVATAPPPASIATVPQSLSVLSVPRRPARVARVPPPASVATAPPLASVARVPPPLSYLRATTPLSLLRATPPGSFARVPPSLNILRMPPPASDWEIPPVSFRWVPPSLGNLRWVFRPTSVARVPRPASVARVPPPPRLTKVPLPPSVTTLLPPANVIKLPPPENIILLPPPASVTTAPMHGPSLRYAASSGIQQYSTATASSAAGGEQGTFEDFPRTIVAYLSEGSCVSSMAFHPLRHAFLLVGTESGDVSIWDVRSKKRLVHRYFKIWELSSSSDTSQLASLANESISVNCVSWSPEGGLFGVGYSKRILHVYSYIGQAEIHNHFQIDAHAGNVSDLTFSSTKTKLCIVTCGDDTTIKIWDAETGSQLFTFVGHEAPVYSVCASDVRVFELISSSADGVIKYWRYGDSNADGYIVKGLSNIKLRYSADGNRLFSSCTYKRGIPYLVEWKYANRAPKLRVYRGLGRSVEVVQFDTTRNKYLAAGDESIIKFWDLDHPELLVTIDYVGGLPASPCIKFNKVGSLLAVSTIDNAVKVLANGDGMRLVRFSETLSLRL